MADVPQMMRPEEVARVLKITVSQVYTLMRSGELPAIKIGRRGIWRVSPEGLQQYIADLERAAQERKTRAAK